MSIVRASVQLAMLVILLAGVASSPARGDRPAGDTCDTAIPVEPETYWTYSGDLAPCANDYDPGLPGPSCTGTVEPGKDMVFAIDMNCTLSMYAYVEPVGFDAALYVVTDCADITGSCVAASDAHGVGGSEGVEVFTFAPTRTFYIIVDAPEDGAGGSFELYFSFMINDFFAGACCFPDGHCEIMDFAYCEPAGGQILGPCISCTPNPCEATPSQERTWGTIKAMYR